MASFSFGSFRLDPDRERLLRDNEPVIVSHKGLLILKKLTAAAGQTVSKQELMDAVWPGLAVEENNLSVQIAALRKVLGAAPGGGSWIHTVPRVGYRFSSAPPEVIPLPSEPGMRPSILVLPFANASNDQAQDYISDGVTEDLIIALSRYRWFAVIPRSSSFHIYKNGIDLGSLAAEHAISHVVEGTLRKDGSRVRITVRMHEVLSGAHIWGERYDFELGDAFAIQDDIAERVAGALEPELLRTAPPVMRHTGNITAWDLVRQGTFRFHQLRCETHLEARDLFRRAAMIDSNLPEAHLWIARVNAGLVAYGWSRESGQDITEGRKAGRRAIELDDRNPYAHYGLAIVSVYAGHFDEAIRAGERAIEAAPSFALGHLVLGMARLFSGNAQEAMGALENGLRLSPHDPQNFIWYNLLALSYLFAGFPQRAEESALKALSIRPGFRTTLEVLVACSVAMENRIAADARRTELHASAPLSGDVLAPMRRCNPTWAGRLASALHDIQD